MPRQKPGKSIQEVQTPAEFLAAVRKKLHVKTFAKDLAADARNTVCEYFFSKEDDALVQAWPTFGWNWLNPPFSDIEPWVQKAYEESQRGAQTAMLVPASTGANWFRDWVHGYGFVELLNGRLTFVGHDKPYPKDLILILYTPATSSWRTSQRSLFGGFSAFSETWPRAGSMRNGTVFPRPPLAPLTDATESGSWPTPTVIDVMGTTEFHPRKESKPETNHAVTLAQKVQWTERMWRTLGAQDGMRGAQFVHEREGHCLSLRDQVKTWPTPRAEYDSGRHRGKPDTLHSAVKMYPTPTVQDSANNGGSSQYERNSLPLNAVVGGALNPTWVEWLMGYPLGWTVCAGWGTRSSRKSPSGSRGKSSTQKG